MGIVIKEKETKGILTKSNLPVSDFSANPYVGCVFGCKYCYASFMKKFTNHSEPWGNFVDIKFWPSIKNFAKYSGKEVFIGSVTYPYQPCEVKYQRTRKLLEELRGRDISISITTKSDLILRDLDLIKTFPKAQVSWSINTLDEIFRKDMDRAVSIKKRLDAMKQFYDAGIQTTCFIAPIFPKITNVQDIILAAKDRCNLVLLDKLNLRDDYKTNILNWIHENHPKLDSLYYSIYIKKDYNYWITLDEEIKEFTRKEGLIYARNDNSRYSEFGKPPIVINYSFHEDINLLSKKF